MPIGDLKIEYLVWKLRVLNLLRRLECAMANRGFQGSEHRPWRLTSSGPQGWLCACGKHWFASKD